MQGLPWAAMIPAASHMNSVSPLAKVLFSVEPSHIMAAWLSEQARYRSHRKMELN